MVSAYAPIDVCLVELAGAARVSRLRLQVVARLAARRVRDRTPEESRTWRWKWRSSASGGSGKH